MKKISLFAAILVMAALVSIGVLSQLSPIIKTVSKIVQITPSISLNESETCTTEFYDEKQQLYNNCIYYHNYTGCLNTSGPNTGCSLQQATWNLQCPKTITVTKNRTTCEPNDDFIISIDQGAAVLKKQIDFSDWGPCIYSQETINSNSCLVVTCVSLYDGAHRGQFTDCRGGKTCQRFEICGSNIKTFYKNSREDFVENDPSFYLPKLGIKEVGK
mgnify:CR=1 FL=1